MGSDDTMSSDNITNNENNNEQENETLSEENLNQDSQTDWCDSELIPLINHLLKTMSDERLKNERDHIQGLMGCLTKTKNSTDEFEPTVDQNEDDSDEDSVKNDSKEDNSKEDNSDEASHSKSNSTKDENSDKEGEESEEDKLFRECDFLDSFIQKELQSGEPTDELYQFMKSSHANLLERIEKFHKLERMKKKFLNGDKSPDLLNSLLQILAIFNQGTEKKDGSNQQDDSRKDETLSAEYSCDYDKIIKVIDNYKEEEEPAPNDPNENSEEDLSALFDWSDLVSNDDTNKGNAEFIDENNNTYVYQDDDDNDDDEDDDYYGYDDDDDCNDDDDDDDDEDDEDGNKNEYITREQLRNIFKSVLNSPLKIDPGEDEGLYKIDEELSAFLAQISASIVKDDDDLKVPMSRGVRKLEMISMGHTADPLSEEKFFDEYPVEDIDEDDEELESDDDNDPDEEEESNPWKADIDEDEIAESAGQPKDEWSTNDEEEFPEDGPVTKERIDQLRDLIKGGEQDKQVLLVRYLMIYVAENHENLPREEAFGMLHEAEEIVRFMLESGDPEGILTHARLLNEKCFLFYFYSSWENKPVPLEASQEAIRIISGYLDNSLSDKEEIRDQLAIAIRIRADSFEQNKAFNSALNERLREEEVRNGFDSAFDAPRRREMVNVYLGIATNYCNLGDFENALIRYRQGLELLEQLVSEGKAQEAFLINTTYRVAMVYRQLHRSESGLALLRQLLDRERRYIAPFVGSLRIMAVYLNHLQIVTDFLIWTNSFQELPAFQDDLIQLCEDLYKKGAEKDHSLTSFFLISLGDIWRMKSMTLNMVGNRQEADAALHRSLQIYVLAYRRFRLDIRPYVVEIGSHKASFLREVQDETDLLRLLEPVTSLLEEILKEEKERVVSLYPRLLHHQGHLQVLLNENAKALSLLDKCLKYWEHIVVDEGRLMWRDSYAASFGERGSYYYHCTKDYLKALSDFNRSTKILYELVEEEGDYSQLGLYTAAIIDRARVLLKLDRNEEAFASMYDLFEFWLKILGQKKAVENLEVVRDFIQILMSLIVQSKDTDHSQGRLGELLDGFYKLRKIYEQDNSFDHLNVVEQIDQITFSLEFLSLIIIDFREDHQAFPLQMEKMLASFREYVLNGETSVIDRGCALIRRYAVEKGAVEGDKRALEFIDKLLNELLESFRAGLLEANDNYTSLFTLRNTLFAEFDEENPGRLMCVARSYDQMKEFAELVQKSNPDEGITLYVTCQIDRALFLANNDNEKEAIAILHQCEETFTSLPSDLTEKLLSLKGTIKFYIGCFYRQSDPVQTAHYFDEALASFNESAKLTQLSNEALSCMADTHRHYARLLVKSAPMDAIKHIEMAQVIFKVLKTQNEEARSSIAVSMFELDLMAGEIYNTGTSEMKDPQKAIDVFCQAESDFFEMERVNQVTHYTNLFSVWVSLVDLYWNNWRYKELTDLGERMENFESDISNFGEENDLCRYCVIRYQMAYYFLIQSKAIQAYQVIDKADKLFKDHITETAASHNFIALFSIMVASVRGWALRELGHFQESFDSLNVVQKKVKKDVTKAIKVIQQKNEQKSEQKYELIFHYRNMLMACSVNLIHLHKYARALRLLQEAETLTQLVLPIIPSDFVNVTFIKTIESEIHYKKKDYQSALECIEAALEFLENKKTEFPVNYGEALRWKGAVLWKLGRNAEAHFACDNGIVCLAQEFNSQRNRGCFELVDLLVLKAKFLFEEKNIASGINLLQGAQSLLEKAQKNNLICHQDFAEEISELLKKYDKKKKEKSKENKKEKEKNNKKDMKS